MDVDAFVDVLTQKLQLRRIRFNHKNPAPTVLTTKMNDHLPLQMYSVVITDQWRTRAIEPYRVVRDIYIGYFNGGRDGHTILVDMVTGAEYYAEGSAYRTAATEFGMRRYDIDMLLDGVKFHVSGQPPIISVSHASGGYCAEWVSRDGNRIDFELEYGLWIVRGYVIIDK